MQKEMIALVLTNKRPAPLGMLSQDRLAALMPFGGKYRIIDFPLSNCIHSGIDTIGILTPSPSSKLVHYIGSGKAWDMCRLKGTVNVLPTTHHAIHDVYYMIDYIDQFYPKYVLILNGDNIYTMDYRNMLCQHKYTKADITLATVQVPWYAASQYRIINMNQDKRLAGFQLEPQFSQSNQASMGVYIFNWKLLKNYLLRTAICLDSPYNIEQNILCPMLSESNYRIFAYPFKSTWIDICSIHSFWKANMDFLEKAFISEFNNKDWPIYTNRNYLPAHYLSPTAYVKESIIAAGCVVHGQVVRSVLFPGVVVEKGALIEDSIVMPYCSIGTNSCIRRCVVCDATKISAHSIVDSLNTSWSYNSNRLYDLPITIVNSDTVTTTLKSNDRNILNKSKLSYIPYV